MKDIWVLRFVSVLFLSNAFLVYEDFPNGLFTIKELGLWASVAFSCIIIGVKLTFSSKAVFQIQLIDIVVLSFLMLLPLGRMAWRSDVANINPVLNQVALGFTYLSFRILFARVKYFALTNAFIEIIIIVLSFHLIIAIAQSLSLVKSFYPAFGSTGAFFNPGPFAIFTISLGVIPGMLFIYAISVKKYLRAFIYVLLFLIAAYFVISSQSRSAWLGGIAGLGIGCIMLLLSWYKQYKEKFSKVFVLITKVRYLFFLPLVFMIPFCEWLYHFKRDSAVGRFLTWQSINLLLKEHWAIGVGAGNFAARYIKYQAIFFIQNPSQIKVYGGIAGDNRFAFNDMLEIFVEKGIIGVLLLGFILISCGRGLIQLIIKGSHHQYILLTASFATAALTTLIVAGLTSYPLTMLPISILFWFLIAIIVSVTSHKVLFEFKVNKAAKLITIALLGICGTIYAIFTIKRATAYTHLLQVRKQETSPEKLRKLISLYSDLNTEPEYLNDIIDIYIENKKYTLAIPYLQRALKFSPKKDFYYNLGICYTMVGAYDSAILQYLTIQNAMPKLLKPRYLIAKMYFIKKDYVTFKKLAKEAIEFVPKFNTPETTEMKKDLRECLLMID